MFGGSEPSAEGPRASGGLMGQDLCPSADELCVSLENLY